MITDGNWFAIILRAHSILSFTELLFEFKSIRSTSHSVSWSAESAFSPSGAIWTWNSFPNADESRDCSVPSPANSPIRIIDISVSFLSRRRNGAASLPWGHEEKTETQLQNLLFPCRFLFWGEFVQVKQLTH